MSIYVMTTVVIQVLGGIVIFLLGMIAYGYSTKSKIMENQDITQAAFIDALTGIGNRYKFKKEIGVLVKNKDKKFALCFLDLDDFKNINDNMGHDAGDELLIALAKKLEESLGDFGKVYRLGGDEYAMIITQAESKLEIETLAKRIQRTVMKTIEIRGSKINLEYSMGISMFPEDSEDDVELINFADSAMYHVKESGKSSYYFHNNALKSQTDNKRRMEKELKEAYENNQFGIDYQPRLNLKNPNEIWLETFLFWNHPMVGKLRAKYFLKYAESIGLIIPIDEYMIEQSIDKINEMNKLGYNNVNIAMNISIKHFQRKDFVDRLCEIFNKKKFKKNSISLEFTDNIDVSKVELYKNMFEKIKEYGVKISVSNFEIKHEIMDVFKRLPIDEIKISSEYLDNSSIFNKNTLKDIIELAKDLEYGIIITKVPNEIVLNKVKEYGVDMVQGNFVFDILESEKLPGFLEQYKLSNTRKK